MATTNNSEPITFRLMDHMHNPNSPFSMEDKEGKTVAILSVRDKWMLPGRQTIQMKNDKGEIVTREIRYLQSASTIFVDEQTKAGIKLELKPKYSELLDLQFEAGELVATKNLQKQFLLACAFNNSFPTELRMPEQYACFEEFKPAVEEKTEIDEFTRNLNAGNKIMEMDEEEAREVLMLWNPTGHVPKGLSLDKLRLLLREVINESHPRTGVSGATFINEGIKKSEDKTRLLVGKALAAEIVSLSDVPGMAAIKKQNGKFEPLCTISEEGGLEAKTNRFVQWLEETTDGKTAVAVIEAQLNAKPKIKGKGKEKDLEPGEQQQPE